MRRRKLNARKQKGIFIAHRTDINNQTTVFIPNTIFKPPSYSMAEPQTIERIEIRDISGRTRTLELAIGDATATHTGAPLDLLVISAFPGNYAPAPGTVIARLKDIGIDVSKLFRSRERDWVDTWQCWLSQPIAGKASRKADQKLSGASIRRLLCFEHALAGRPEDLVGNVFRAIRDWLLTPSFQSAGKPAALGSVDTVRMPLLSTGNQGHPSASMLAAIVEQAIVHLAAGLPVDRIQLVIWEGHRDLHQLLIAFGRLTTEASVVLLPDFLQEQPATYDLFLSYRRTDAHLAHRIVRAVRAKRDDMRVFVDQEALDPGCCWKPALLKALANCRNAICVVTDGYPSSPECIDEFHAAVCLGQVRPGYLLPLLCLSERSVDALPASLRRINFIPAACPPATVDDVAATILQNIDRR
jgi:hypothetical protein